MDKPSEASAFPLMIVGVILAAAVGVLLAVPWQTPPTPTPMPMTLPEAPSEASPPPKEPAPVPAPAPVPPPPPSPSPEALWKDVRAEVESLVRQGKLEEALERLDALPPGLEKSAWFRRHGCIMHAALRGGIEARLNASAREPPLKDAP